MLEGLLFADDLVLRSLPSQIWPALEKKASFPIFVVDVCDTPFKC